MLTATMKGIVALTGLEAVSNGIQFFKHEDFKLVRWGKAHAPKLNWLWHFYSGKSGIGRVVQTSFLFYGATTTLFLTYFSIHFNVFDGTFGRSLVGNLAFIGFTQIPGGTFLFWIYQILAVALLARASMTALQDAQATEWRDVAIGEIPEAIIYRDRARHVHPFGDDHLRRRRADHAPGARANDSGCALLRHRRVHADRHHGLRRAQAPPGALHRAAGGRGARRLAGLAGLLSTFIFVFQIIGKWEEGGWIRLLTFTVLITTAHLLLLSPIGLPRRGADPPHRPREGQGSRRHGLDRRVAVPQDAGVPLTGCLSGMARFWTIFGVRRPLPPVPIPAGDYDHALHTDDPNAPSLLAPYLTASVEPEPAVHE